MQTYGTTFGGLEFKKKTFSKIIEFKLCQQQRPKPSGCVKADRFVSIGLQSCWCFACYHLCLSIFQASLPSKKTCFLSPSACLRQASRYLFEMWNEVDWVWTTRATFFSSFNRDGPAAIILFNTSVQAMCNARSSRQETRICDEPEVECAYKCRGGGRRRLLQRTQETCLAY